VTAPASINKIASGKPARATARHVAHPDMLRADEKRCAGDAASISPAACENADHAAARLFVKEMQKAADANGKAADTDGANKSSAEWPWSMTKLGMLLTHKTMQVADAKCQRNDGEVPIQACKNITTCGARLHRRSRDVRPASRQGISVEVP
jgi:hypothetical protein